MPKTIDEMRNDMYIIRTSIGIDSESKKTASTILGHLDGLYGHETLYEHPRTYQRLYDISLMRKKNLAIEILCECLTHYKPYIRKQ